MKTIGFPISHKENENRRVIVPEQLALISNPDKMYFEENYGEVLGIHDNQYAECGCQIVPRTEVLKQDIICDPKIGDAEYLDDLSNQTIFGWVHATQNEEITDKIVDNKLTAYAWENMFYEGRHVFWRNNQLAGEAAVLHAFLCYGKMPCETKVAVIGRGNTAQGAINVLHKFGAEVYQYNRKMENLIREELSQFDVVVNCVLWDVTREDHIIYREDLAKMKTGSMIIDVSCDRNGGIETCVPTTINDPTYEVDGIFHYAVDHTPTFFYKTFTKNNSSIIYPYIEELICDNYSKVLQDALIIEKGVIIDQEINIYQNRGK